MPLDSLAFFPLYPATPNGQCSCGNSACSRAGKHPRVLWRDVVPGDFEPTPPYGIKTGAVSGIFVVDLDGEEAEDAFEDLGGCEPTYEVSTPRGSHLYFKHPGFPVKTSAGVLGKGVDIRGEGGYVVGPGSPHKSGKTYEIREDLPLADAPDWLLERLKADPVREAQTYDGDVTDEKERAYRRGLYEDFLRTAKPCVQGAGGDRQLFEVVQYGAWDLALPTDDVLELVEEHFDPRCVPPWGDELEERVLHKAHTAKTASTRERRPPLLAVEAEDLAPVLEPTSLVPDGSGTGNRRTKIKVKWGGWDETPKPLIYLVDDFLVEGSVSMIYADPGSIKSWTALDLATCIASGRDWLGEKRVRKGATLYADYEDGEFEFHRRIRMLTDGDALPDVGYAWDAGRVDERVFWENVREIHADTPLSLVVIDTMAGATPGVDENDRNAALGLQEAGRFAASTGVTVLVLHHANKGGGIRGTSAFTANADVVFKLETLDDRDGNHRAKLTCVKSGYKKTKTLFLELSDENGLRSFDPEEGKEGPADPSSAEEQKRPLKQLKEDVRLYIEAEGPIRNLKYLAASVKASKSAVGAVVAELMDALEVYKGPNGYVTDNEFKATERVRQAVAHFSVWTKEGLAKETGVPSHFIDALLANKTIAPKGSGKDNLGFIVVPR